MEQIKPYAFSAIVTKLDNNGVYTVRDMLGYVYVGTEIEAHRFAMDECLKRHPMLEGWSNHRVATIEVLPYD